MGQAIAFSYQFQFSPCNHSLQNMGSLTRSNSQLFCQCLTACDTVFCQVCLKNFHLIFYWDSAAYGIIADANFRELAFPVQAGQVLPSGSRGDIQ